MRRFIPARIFPVVSAALLGFAPAGLHADPLRLTMDEAAARAVAENLDLQAAAKDVAVADAEITRSESWFPSNPVLSAGTQTRSQGGNTVSGSGYYFGYLSQEFEIAGQHSARAAVAQNAKAKEQASLDDTTLSLIASVRINFIKALVADKRVELARQAADVSARLRGSGRKRQLTASELIEANSARIQSARFDAALAEAQEDRDNIYEALRHQVALPPDSQIELSGSIPETVEPQPAVEPLIERAIENRADLRALRSAAASAEAQLSLEKRRRFPNVTLSASVTHFDGDTVFGGDVGFPLPLFHTNAGEVGQAVAEQQRSEIHIRDLRRQIEQEIHTAYRACATKGAAVQRYRDTVMPLSTENVQLQQRLWDRDESNEVDYLGAKLEMLSAHGEYIDALEAYQTARIELDRIVGLGLADRSSPPQP